MNGFPSKLLFSAACVAFGTLLVHSTSAQTLLYWDATGSGTGGTGNWLNDGTGFRSGSSTCTITGLNNNTSAIAVFDGVDPALAGTVTLGATPIRPSVVSAPTAAATSSPSARMT